ncbi:MAG: SUMF1/EgtB/PvdO family nonheme iron enzyme [Myxococcota bacterium]
MPPGEDASLPIWLPPLGTISRDEVYVPAGWFLSGGDPQAEAALPLNEVWLDAFIIQRFPVTNRDFIVFLDDLVAAGREDEALEFAPRERAGPSGTTGPLIYGRDENGRFMLPLDADGDQWEPDWPVLKVSFTSARAYAKWLAAREGLPWRLPSELEWEKAARGVDGRWFPWGDYLDPTFCCMQDSHAPGRRLPSSVSAYPLDESPYGVRGMAGNARDWCLDPFSEEGPFVDEDGQVAPVWDGDWDNIEQRRVVRGGAWWQRADQARAANRLGVRAFLRDVGISFRLIRSISVAYSAGTRGGSARRPAGGSGRSGTRGSG